MKLCVPEWGWCPTVIPCVKKWEMISPKRELSSPIEVGGSLPTPLRAYSDQNIFRNERVLRTLLRREVKHTPTSKNYFTSIQTDLKPHMRKEVANWMLEICEEEHCAPQVFCLAINYLDRFLSVCNIRRWELSAEVALFNLVRLYYFVVFWLFYSKE